MPHQVLRPIRPHRQRPPATPARPPLKRHGRLRCRRSPSPPTRRLWRSTPMRSSGPGRASRTNWNATAFPCPSGSLEGAMAVLRRGEVWIVGLGAGSRSSNASGIRVTKGDSARGLANRSPQHGINQVTRPGIAALVSQQCATICNRFPRSSGEDDTWLLPADRPKSDIVKMPCPSRDAFVLVNLS